MAWRDGPRSVCGSIQRSLLFAPTLHGSKDQPPCDSKRQGAAEDAAEHRGGLGVRPPSPALLGGYRSSVAKWKVGLPMKLDQPRRKCREESDKGPASVVRTITVRSNNDFKWNSPSFGRLDMLS